MDGTLTPLEQRRLEQEYVFRHAGRKLFHSYGAVYDPANPLRSGAYPWQVEFHNAGKDNRERLLMKANRVGGTTCAAAEVAMHATGHYPPWWDGKRFDRPTTGWCGGESTEAVRDIIQEALLGPVGEWGTGWLPREHMIGTPRKRQAGVSDVIDQIHMRHKAGGISTIGIKTYEQGREKWQGRKLDWVWCDEQPPMDIYTEALLRVMDSNGILLLTFTPLKGEDEVVLHFRSGGRGIYMKNVSWADAPHLSEQQKEDFLASLPEHERETRASGLPMQGTGVIFPISDSDIAVEPFKIPDHWARINGLDFGIDHPQATAFCAHDRDADTFYVYDCYRASNQTPVYHAAASKKHGEWIPHAWPKDGFARDKGSGVQLRLQYREHGLVMASEPAGYRDERADHVEPGVIEMLEWMRTGRFKVFKTLSQWFEEKRLYHREDGVIVKIRDDILSATRYAFVSRRLARTRPRVVVQNNAFRGPILGSRRWKE